ncbi:alpha/beta fold hydrolase [Nocardioides euryhalodurans]|uniref:Alpha/beta fold hydrolase n=1 Tax=Nocardioides euryhalodurans TaxID=2518370 RepID=A0A4P7GMF3_9ACTN|nr:alpha/beta fold hydrolase [Nocardioides euryhalodurans]QBR93200.1 alpha/beta fold hydrolase [Nocardioides euryhalodurans]
MPTRDHVLEVPLDHDRPDGPTISVYAREVAEHGGEDRPYLVFLQGGPGSESPRPNAFEQPAWIARALRDFRLLLLDQRGTGRSTPVGSYEQVPGGDVHAKAAYLTHFRADAIVRDCELLREHLGVEQWSLLGQSFGGFTATTYLSLAAESLAAVHITGGLPGIGFTTEEIYAQTYVTMQAKCERFYRRFPGDRDRLRAALDLAGAGELRLPSGDVLTPRLLRSIGGALGMDGGEERLHHLLELDPTSPAFSHDVAAQLPFGARNPIYTFLHESCCADGQATRWAAHQVRPAAYDEDETLLSGEHIAPWHFEDCPDLRQYAELAEVLAAHEWPRLYDEQALRQADVPVAACVYYDDAFVDREMSLRTAALLPRVDTWITNEHEHSGLRTSGERVLDRLIGLAREV